MYKQKFLILSLVVSTTIQAQSTVQEFFTDNAHIIVHSDTQTHTIKSKKPFTTLNNNNNVSVVVHNPEPSFPVDARPASTQHSLYAHNQPFLTPPLLPSAPASPLLACKTWAYENWGKLTLGAAASLYGAVLVKLCVAAHCIQEPNSWSCWHHEIPMANLRMLTVTDVTQELVETIITHYPPSTPVIAIALFLKDTDAEIASMQDYLALVTFLEKTGLLSIFPTQTTHRNSAQEKLERLVFLQNIIANWPFVLYEQGVPTASASHL